MAESCVREDLQDPGQLLCSVFAHEVANSLHVVLAQWSDVSIKLAALIRERAKSLRLITEGIDRLTLLLKDFRSFQLFRLDLEPTSLVTVISGCLALKLAKRPNTEFGSTATFL